MSIIIGGVRDWPRLTMRLAAIIRADLRVQRAEYEEEKRRAGGWLDYCVHGTYIGTWWGPDYMCGTCEMGVTDDEIALGSARVIVDRWDTRMSMVNNVIDSCRDAGEALPDDVRERLVDWALEPMREAPEPVRRHLP